MKQNINESEKQLNDFLEHTENTYTQLMLSPQGDTTVINKEAVNLCHVRNNGHEYLFGGISESFYDSMVGKYDWREDAVKLNRRQSTNNIYK